MRKKLFCLLLCCFMLMAAIYRPLPAQAAKAATNPATRADQPVGEKVPSEDATIKNLHSLGLINGQLNIFRSACPVRDLAKQMTTTQPTDDQFKEAKTRLQHLHDLGVRTIISFQDPSLDAEEGKDLSTKHAVALERSAAEAVGIKYVSHPMSNAGPHSLQTMTDQEVVNWIDPISVEIFDAAKAGGVLFHCSAGHDRAGIVAAYLRLKYQHWPVEQAIDEMRRLGHNWPKYSDNGGTSSWHEAHLRAIAAILEAKPSDR